MNELADPNEERLFQRVNDILTDSRGRVARTVNTEMVSAYWRIGREIFEIEQQGLERANYGAGVVARLALAARYQQCLPSEDELRERLARDREDAERTLLHTRE